jgi:hypothetical protein
LLALLGTHAFNGLHATAGGARVIGKGRPRHTHGFRQTLPQTSQNAHAVPEQATIGGVMNIGVDDRGVNPKFAAVLDAQFDRGANDQLVDGLQGVWRESTKGTMKGVVGRHRLAVEIRELAQGIAIAIRSCNSRYSQFLMRRRRKLRRTWEGVKPLRPVLGFFNPRSRS